MHAKIVTFEMKPGKRAEVIRLFRDFIVPGAEKQRGFRGGLLLTDPKTDKGTSVALWETEADISAAETSGYYR